MRRGRVIGAALAGAALGPAARRRKFLALPCPSKLFFTSFNKTRLMRGPEPRPARALLKRGNERAGAQAQATQAGVCGVGLGGEEEGVALREREREREEMGGGEATTLAAM